MQNNFSNPPKWDVIIADDDGSYGFHAIMYSLSHQSRNNYQRIS
jgi:hypothetical protein